MTYKITDEFLDKVDTLLDAVMEMAQHADIMTASEVAIVNLNKFEAIRDNAVRLCDAMEDGFPDYEGKDDEDEEDTEDCTDPGDDDPAAVFNDPDGAGCDSDAD